MSDKIKNLWMYELVSDDSSGHRRYRVFEYKCFDVKDSEKARDITFVDALDYYGRHDGEETKDLPRKHVRRYQVQLNTILRKPYRIFFQERSSTEARHWLLMSFNDDHTRIHLYAAEVPLISWEQSLAVLVNQLDNTRKFDTLLKEEKERQKREEDKEEKEHRWFMEQIDTCSNTGKEIVSTIVKMNETAELISRERGISKGFVLSSWLVQTALNT